MKVHIFGATSSPSCTNFALRKCAQDNKGQFSQETDKIFHCFYVDDCLMSVASEEETVSLYHNVVTICAKGGFNTKWISNKGDVVAAIPDTYRAKDTKRFNTDQDLLPVERVLGVEWCIQSDTFRFKIVIKNRPFTRRGILTTINFIYNSLGILSPVVLCAKQILRDFCRRAFGWDDIIPESVVEEVTSWLQELCLLEDFNIMRCLKPLDFGEVTKAQLHHFCDAGDDVNQLTSDDPEVTKTVSVNTEQAREEVDAMTRIIHHFSSWTRLRKSFAWILRFKDWLLFCHQKRRQFSTVLAQSDLDVKQQRRALEKDMNTLKRAVVPNCAISGGG